MLAIVTMHIREPRRAEELLERARAVAVQNADDHIGGAPRVRREIGHGVGSILPVWEAAPPPDA